MRLIQQQAYYWWKDGSGWQVFYDGIWNPSSSAQFVSWHKDLVGKRVRAYD